MQLILLTIAVTAGIFSKVALTSVQEAMRAALHLSDNQVALIQGAALALPMLVIGIPLGLLVDRYSRARLLLISAVLLLAGSLLTVAASSFATLFAARSLVGLALLAMYPIAFSLRADLYGPAQRGRAGMVMWIAQMVGTSAAFAIGGALVVQFSPDPDAWRRTMFWMTVPLLAFVVLSTRLLREPARTGQIIERPSVQESFVQLWRFRAVILPVIFGRTFAILALGSVMIWTAPMLMRVFSLAADQVGAIMAVAMPLGGVVGIVLGGFLADRCQRVGGPRRTIIMAAVLALLALPLCPFPFMPGLASASVLLAGLLAVLSAISAMTSTIVVNVIPNEIRGLYGGVADGITAFLSTILGPLLVSLVSSAIGGPAMIGTALALVCATASLFCAATFVFGRRYFTHAIVY